MTKYLFVVYLIIIGLTATDSVSAESYDEWIRKGTGVVTQMAQGNPQGVLYQAIPGYQTQLVGPTYVNAGASGANLQYQIVPLNRFNSRYLGFDGSYNIGSSYGMNQLPSFSQNAQISAHNPYFTNTSTLTPRFKQD